MPCSRKYGSGEVIQYSVDNEKSFVKEREKSHKGKSCVTKDDDVIRTVWFENRTPKA